MTEEQLDQGTERRHLRALPDPDEIDDSAPEVEGTAVPAAEADETGRGRDQPGPVPVDPPAGKEQPVDRSAQWRPVLPPWVRSRTELASASRWAASYAGHTTAYHAVRSPAYAGRLVARSPRGAGRAVAGAARWVFDAEGSPVRADAVRRGDSKEYMRLLDRRNARVRQRLLVVGACGALALAAAVALVLFTGPVAQWAALAAFLVALGLAGAPEDKPLLEVAVVKTSAQRLTSASIIRALGALGIGEINKALAKGGQGVNFPAPIQRDGPGWRADIDLPHGVTVTDIMERRDRLASGLRRPLGCVWPEGDSASHEGRLVLWVGDQDMSQAKPAAWPLAKHGRCDLFKPLPFGTDQRGRPVELPLMYSNMLIGAMPGAGKTSGLRVPLLAASLDPHVQLRVYELKGSGDLSPLRPVAHHYGSGPDDATVEAALLSLREVHKQLEKRARTIASLPREQCPENKVTPELAARRDLGLFPLVVAVDECQELFAHPDFGKEAAELSTAIIKRGRALGVILLLATQRPDKDSLPTGVSANVGVRFCLRVMGQTENDMILGTSMYKNGVRATTFTNRDKGIGYLVGAADDPQITRAYYLDAQAADRVIARAWAARKAAGTLTGHALGEDDDLPRHNLLDDVTAVFQPGEQQLWSETIVERLAELRRDSYGGWSPAQLSAGLKPHGVATRQIAGYASDGERRNRYGVHLEHITQAVTRRDRGEEAPGL